MISPVKLFAPAYLQEVGTLSNQKLKAMFAPKIYPGVKTFSRRKLVKGDEHYFDSVSDVLRKVVAEPNLLDVEEAKVGSCL